MSFLGDLLSGDAQTEPHPELYKAPRGNENNAVLRRDFEKGFFFFHVTSEEGLHGSKQSGICCGGNE